ncbi:hypothetical protein YC2023_112556 [Brassica napus]
MFYLYRPRCFLVESPPSVTVAGSTSNINCSLEDLSEFHLSTQDSSLASHQYYSMLHENSVEGPFHVSESESLENSRKRIGNSSSICNMYHILLTTNNPENGLGRKGSRKRKVFPTERERRVHFKDRIGDLKNLIPNPTED